MTVLNFLSYNLPSSSLCLLFLFDKIFIKYLLCSKHCAKVFMCIDLGIVNLGIGISTNRTLQSWGYSLEQDRCCALPARAYNIVGKPDVRLVITITESYQCSSPQGSTDFSIVITGHRLQILLSTVCLTKCCAL